MPLTKMPQLIEMNRQGADIGVPTLNELLQPNTDLLLQRRWSLKASSLPDPAFPASAEGPPFFHTVAL